MGAVNHLDSTFVMENISYQFANIFDFDGMKYMKSMKYLSNRIYKYFLLYIVL
jgi:hypothetical protein